MSKTKIGQGLLGLICLSLLGCPRIDTNRVDDHSDFQVFEYGFGGPVFGTGDVLTGATIQRQANGQYQFEAIVNTANPEVRDADGFLHLPPRILTQDEVSRMRTAFSHIEMHIMLSFQLCPTDQFVFSFRWDDFKGVNSTACPQIGDQVVNEPSVEEIAQMMDDFWHAGG